MSLGEFYNELRDGRPGSTKGSMPHGENLAGFSSRLARNSKTRRTDFAISILSGCCTAQADPTLADYKWSAGVAIAVRSVVRRNLTLISNHSERIRPCRPFTRIILAFIALPMILKSSRSLIT
jgi:hypothetical protein